jgi:hypothetical protein
MNKQFANVVVGVAGFVCSMAGTLCAAEQAKPEGRGVVSGHRTL